MPEKKGLLDEMEDLEAKRKARADKNKKEGKKEAKSDLDLDGIW